MPLWRGTGHWACNLRRRERRRRAVLVPPATFCWASPASRSGSSCWPGWRSAEAPCGPASGWRSCSRCSPGACICACATCALVLEGENLADQVERAADQDVPVRSRELLGPLQRGGGRASHGTAGPIELVEHLGLDHVAVRAGGLREDDRV